MGRQFVAVVLALGFVPQFLTAIDVKGAAVFFGPTPYLTATDSPIYATVDEYFYREDFEDGNLSTAGVTPTPAGIITSPRLTTDSVDNDNGPIDGLGNSGRSLLTGGATNSFSFQFSPVLLSGLPTRAGIVWTDVGAVDDGPLGFGTVIFEAFGPANESLGTVAADSLGDGSINGGTAEDRFFGVVNQEGISRITISMPHSTDWEVDHLQYLRVIVPEPTAVSLAAIALTGFASLNRRRSRS